MSRFFMRILPLVSRPRKLVHFRTAIELGESVRRMKKSPSLPCFVRLRDFAACCLCDQVSGLPNKLHNWNVRCITLRTLGSLFFPGSYLLCALTLVRLVLTIELGSSVHHHSCWISYFILLLNAADIATATAFASTDSTSDVTPSLLYVTCIRQTCTGDDGSDGSS